jgi:hypothetical protein
VDKAVGRAAGNRRGETRGTGAEREGAAYVTVGRKPVEAARRSGGEQYRRQVQGVESGGGGL